MPDELQDHETPTERSQARKFIDAKSTQIKADVREIVRDDLIGVSSWQKSKVGSVLGLGLAMRQVGRLGDAMVESTSRLNGLWASTLASEDLPETLEDDPKARFELSIETLGVSERSISIGIRNTFWGFWLYTALIGVFGAIATVSFVLWPAHNILVALARVGLLPFLMAMAFKHGYTNWMFRVRGYFPIYRYFTSGDFLPKIKAR